MFFNVFVLSGIVFLVLYIYFQLVFSYWKKRNVPTIKPILPFGNFGRSIITHNPFFQVNKYYKDFEGEIFGGLYILHRPSLLVRDPEIIKQVLTKDFNHFYHRGFYTDEENEPLQGHLFAISGSKWRNLRNKLNPTFSSAKMKMMFPIVAETGDELQKYLKKPAAHNEVIEIKDVLARYNTDIIVSVAFGIQCNCLKDPNSDFRKWGKQMFDPSIRTRVANTINFLIPLLPKFTKFFLFDQDMSRNFIEMVKNTVEYREKNNVIRNDFMQLLIQLKNKTLGEEEYDPLLKLSPEEISGMKTSASFEVTMNVIAAQAFGFFGAGFETSSTTMAFCLYEMALHPDIQDRVRSEIDSILLKYDGRITYESIQEMDYLDKVVKETLRKYPPLTVLVRDCTETTKLKGTDLTVEKGIRVLVPIMGLHHDPKFFPDPHKFDPERFNEEEKSKRHPFCYIPFGEGPRICIGMRFGLMQTKVGLINILSNYEVKVTDKTPIPLEFQNGTFILASKGGMWLKIANRNNKDTLKN